MIDTLLHWIGFGLCHQLPARSFFAVGGVHQVPVCARDEGIYLGFVVSYLIAVGFARGRRPSGAPPRWLIVLGVLLIGAMAFDGITSYAGLRETDNAIRLATGLGAGYAVGLFIVPMLNAELWAAPGRGRPLGGPWWEPAIWIVSMPAVFALAWWALPWLGIGYALLVTAAILATFTIVNMVLVSLMWPYDRRAVRWLDTLPIAGIGLVLTFVELAAAAGLKYALEVWSSNLGAGR